MQLKQVSKMSEQEITAILKRLKDDKEYYGDFGRNFISASDMKILNEQPQKFRSQQADALPLLKGSYFHTLVLEPAKIDDYIVFDGASRNSAKYKDFATEHGKMCLLQKEVDELVDLKEKMIAKDIVADLINQKGNEFEVPMITELFGKNFKGKADILNHSKKMIIDIKTTSDINRFVFSAREYYYNSQAWIYEQLFPNYEFLFIVVCKKSGEVKIFTCSEVFLDNGLKRVESALQKYELFYSEDSIEDVYQYVETIEL